MTTLEYIAELEKIGEAESPEQLTSLAREYEARYNPADPVLSDLLHVLHMTALARYGTQAGGGLVTPLTRRAH